MTARPLTFHCIVCSYVRSFMRLITPLCIVDILVCCGMLHVIWMSSSALAWDMSAIPDGLTELEVFQPTKEEKPHPRPPPPSVPSQAEHEPEKLPLGGEVLEDHKDVSKSKRVGSFSQLQTTGSQVVQEKSKLQAGYPCNLSTITEESASYKSSSSSGSRLTVSSASSK